MKYKLAIFDMDGTILNTLEDLADSLNHILAENGYRERTLKEVRSFVGNGIRKLIEQALPAGTGDAEIQRLFQEFLPYYKEHCADKTKPYPGVTQLICELRAAGCLVAVVSNKEDAAVQKLCVQYFDGLFDAAVGEKPGICRKPAPDSVEYVLERLSVTKDQAVYIGDSDVDVATARNAGLDCIAVKWGFREEAFLRKQGAEVLVDTPKELWDMII